MKKGIIITGPQTSGKTTKAKEIASKFPKEEVLFLCIKDIDYDFIPFKIPGCTKDTKLIIIEEYKNITDFESFFNIITKGVYIENQGKEPLLINPQIVFVCHSDVLKNNLPTGASFTCRFDIIECDYNEQLILKCKLSRFEDLSLINAILVIGYRLTGSKFNLNFNGSKGYLSNIEIECEGIQKERNNVIWIEKLLTKKRTLRSKMVSIYHSEENGIRVDV